MKTRNRRVEIMNDERGMRQRWDECDIISMWNVVNRWEKYGIIESSDDANGENEEIVNEVEGAIGEIRASEIRIRRRQRCR